MRVKKSYFLIGLLLPFVCMANNQKHILTRVIESDNRDNRVIEYAPSRNDGVNDLEDNVRLFSKKSSFTTSVPKEENNGEERLGLTRTYSVKAEETNFRPVKIQVLGQAPESPNLDFLYFNSSSCAKIEDYQQDGDIFTIFLPQGNNDIMIMYFQRMIIDDTQSRPVWINRGVSYYIIEDVEVGDETPILVADLTQCNAIPLQIYLGSGEEVIFPKKRWNGKNYEIVSEGNVPIGIMENLFYNSKYDFQIPFSSFRSEPWQIEGFEDVAIEFWQTKVNKVSDNWVFANTASLLDNEDNFSNFSWLVTPSTEKVVISKEDYSLVPWNINEDNGQKVKGISCNTTFSINNSFWAKSQMGHAIDAVIGESSNIYMANTDFRVNNNTSDWNLILDYLAATDVEIDEDEGEYYLYGISTPNYKVEKDGGVYLPGTRRFATKPYNDEQGWTAYDFSNWGAKEFNCPESQMGLKFNGSAPYVVSYFNYEVSRESGEVLLIYPESSIIGLAGDNRDNLDWYNQKFNISFNGEVVSQPNSIFEFIYNWNPTEKGEGVLQMDVEVNTDLYIDGIQAKNNRTMILHQGAKDRAFPTVTCLQPRNQEDVVTNKFDNISDGHFVLSASDILPAKYWKYFEDWEEWLPYYWFEVTYGAEVKAEASPCGEENWEDLEVIPTGEKNPALGDFYDINLNQITTTSANGWYDLRITVTNKTGNSQQQTITPAFHVNNQVSSVQTIGTHQPTEIKAIYNVSGTQLKSMEPGLNIVVYSDGTSRKVILK